MSALPPKRRSIAVSVAVPTLIAAALAAVPGSAVAASPQGGVDAAGAATAVVPLRAVVALAGAGAVDAPGVHVERVLPAVHSEIVTGTPGALAGLARTRGVLGVAPDARVTTMSKKDDHDHDGHSFVYAWNGLGGRAGRPGAGRGVTVAVVDTGVSDTLSLNRASGRLVDGIDTSGLAGAAGTISMTGPFTDGFGHGTFMASLIAGGAAPGTGHHGVGVAPSATVEVVKVAGDDGTTSLSAVLAGLNWVAVNAGSIQVANLSLGTAAPGPHYGMDPLNVAVEWVRDAGVTVVAAAGNTPGTVTDPGFDPRALTVGAADTRTDRVRVADFSGSATVAGVQKPDVVAAGVGVLGVLPDDSVIARDHPDAQRPNGLWRGSGTSQATAITSGVAAMFLAAHPGATPVQVKASLRAAADPVAGRGDGEGLVQVADRVENGRRVGGGHGRFDDGTGEIRFDANSWQANSWQANSWQANSWQSVDWLALLANSWQANSWQANSWQANSWQANSWQANSWQANSWQANSWQANSWQNDMWGADAEGGS